MENLHVCDGGLCPAWPEEPECPRADDGAHAWGPDDAHCVGPEAFRFAATCARCGLVRAEEYFGPGRKPGACDRRSYAPGYYTVHVLDFDRPAATAPAPGKLIARCVSAEEAAAVARARAHDFLDGTCVCSPDGTVDYGDD
jgi:hypothetical protein